MAETTTNHEEIRKWVEDRKGHPARVKGTEVLRIDYPGFSGEDTLEPLEWDQFFEWFDRDKLAFLYQSGGDSRFSKFVARGSASSSAKRSSAKRSGAKRGGSKKGAPSSKKSASSSKNAASS